MGFVGRMGAKELSETAREREVFKYYQPTLGPKPQDALLAPRSSNDPILTAFAQLGALRLNAQRGMISLVAREHQYIIAEATRTLSLQSDIIHDEADALWKGETIVQRSDGPSSVALDLFTRGADGERDCLIVNDLSIDDRFSDMESVNGFPFTRFYVAVPLTTAKGLVIGAFYVLDDKPRNGISNAETAFMKDISSTITAHLEAKRIKTQYQRAERMIRGLGLYVEGKSSLREWWLRTGHKTNDSEVNEKTRQGESLMQQADEKFGVQELPDSSHMSSILGMPLLAQQSNHSASKAEMTYAKTTDRPQYPASDTTATSTPSSELHDDTFTKQPEVSNSAFSQETSISSHYPVSEAPTNRRLHSFDSQDETSGARLQEAVLSNELKESFSRASNLIRESIGVEGVLFLDASVGTFGGSSTKSDLRLSGPGALNYKSTSATTSSSDDTLRQSSNITVSQKTCGILGYSTPTRSSFNMHEASALHLSVAESFLRKLVRRYPHGKVFNFHQDGSLSSSEEEVRETLHRDIANIPEELGDVVNETRQRKRKKKRLSKEAVAKEISKLLLDSRSVAFFPLWDSHKERWFSGCFVWSKSPTRILDPEEDLTYLASFGNSIMAEVSRLDALSNSQLKNSFVSSISHELRSPLHGVLASVEFLQDSPLNALQQEMVSIIGSCGKTLLDTINHVLDFTKFRSTAKDKAKDDKKHSRRNSTRAISMSSDKPSIQTKSGVDIRLLTEEVLEGVYTGSGFGKSPSIRSTESAISPSDSFLPISQKSSPMIIVNVDWRSDWGFDVDPGAWRRLVMNVFGNALKYTEAGFICVSLGSKIEGKSTTGASSVVTLTVADSGKGISNEFLNHHLYTPFAQEDSLAVGSGLGLSIVRHIVDELGGSIVIESELESGTNVTISLPLTPSKLPTLLEGENDPILQIRNQVQDLEVCLVGFDVFPSLVDEPTGILSMDIKRTFYIKDSLIAIFRDWFSMEVTVSAKLNPPNAMISVIMESTFNDLLADGFIDAEMGVSDHEKSILLVYCTRPYKSYPTVLHPNFDVNYIQQPIGPHKLASTLARCLASKKLPGPQLFTSAASPTVPTMGNNLSPILEKPPTAVSVSQRPVPVHRVSTQTTTSSKTLVSSPSPSSSSSKSNITYFPERANVSLSTVNSPSSRGKVLLVEDNAINLKLLITYMQKLGVEYAIAEDGLQALQVYKGTARPFNLIIMDISMPVMDGLEASRKIRIFEQGSNRARVPIVAITGAASESSRQDAFSAGIDQFLTKPVSLKVLRGVIDDYGLIG